MVFAIIITIIIIVLILIFFVIGNYFYNVALNPKISKALVMANAFPQSSKEEIKNIKKDNFDWLEKNAKDVYINSFDNLKLHAYKVENKTKTNNWVIIIHGYNASADEMVPAAKFFQEEGFNMIIVNLRGHGLSQGKYIGMGWNDRLDIISWIDKIILENSKSNIILYGESMGAATVMMTIGEKLPSNVKVAIEDCGYTSVNDEFKHILKRALELPSFPILFAAGIVTRIKSGFSLKKASSITQLQNSKIPTLFIHGDSDDFVPFRMLDELYDIAPCKKEKLIVKDAGHAQSRFVNPELFWRTVFNFIEQNIKSS